MTDLQFTEIVLGAASRDVVAESAYALLTLRAYLASDAL